jgi:hypothetical protein
LQIGMASSTTVKGQDQQKKEASKEKTVQK